MKTMSYTESRARYAEVLDHVEDHREEVVIISSRDCLPYAFPG